MVWRSLQHVLGSFEAQANWQQRQQFQRLQRHWATVVGPGVAAQTRPIAIQAETLKVATSSAMWAQNLMFERQRILAKLNAKLPFTLKDIRFSTAQWYDSQELDIVSEAERVWQHHPSRLSAPQPRSPQNLRPSDPATAFQQWAEIVRSRSHTFPLCPLCQCPTPKGELERWAKCSLCAAKSWGYQAPIPPPSDPRESTGKPGRTPDSSTDL